MRVLALGDTHAGIGRFEDYALPMRDMILTYKNRDHSKPLEAVVVLGDLTDHGYGSTCCYSPEKDGKQDEKTLFVNEFYNSITRQYTTHCCLGNHDTTDRKWYQKAMETFMREHEGLYYTFEVDPVLFICCNIYPDIKCRIWLWFVLKFVSKKKPLIFCFHYNTCGPMSDWWTDKQKQKFFDLIRHHNVLCILTGHNHVTEVTRWKGIVSVVCSGSDRCVLVDVDEIVKINDEKLDPEYMLNLYGIDRFGRESVLDVEQDID